MEDSLATSKHVCLKVRERLRLQDVKGPECKGRQSKPLTKMMIAFLVSELFLMALEALKAVTKKRWAVINDAIIVDALVSVTMNGKQRPALSISRRVQKCMLTDMNRRRRMRTNIITMWGFWRLIFRIWKKTFYFFISQLCLVLQSNA